MKAYRNVTAALALTALVAGAGRAQVADKKALTLDGAKKIASAAAAEARRNNEGGVIAIVDDGGNLMYLERLDNTFAAGANISIGKARTAALFKKPTRVFEEIIKNGRTAMVALADFTPLQGGVPLELNGQVIGGIGVSGAASQQQDEAVALAGAAALGTVSTSSAEAPAPPVTYFDREKVAAAFAQGAVLFDGSGANYMVHASRRDRPGMAEIHTKDTDVIYVLEGSASFVTGGTATETKNIAPDEIRGTAIRSGTTRRIARGDVIIVPAGIPHWFKEVSGPLNYYVVKVR